MERKHILKQAGVLLITALIMCTSGAAVANTIIHEPVKQTPAPFHRDLIWDNVMGLAGSRGGIIVSTVRAEGTAFPADDFQLATTETVTSVAWQGGYFQCQLAQGQKDYHWDWRILFWNDVGNGSWPGAEIYNNTISDASIIRSFWYNYTRPSDGQTYWVANYSCSLPESITFTAGVKYWITIQAIQTPNSYPQGAWCRHNSSQSPIKLHEGMIKASWWGYPDWVTIFTLLGPGGDPNPLPHDLNFQLLGGTAPDTEPPVTTCTITGTNPVTVTLNATDVGSGVNYTKYKLDGGLWTTYIAPFMVTDVGDHTVYYYSVDNAGNIETEKSTNFTVEAPPIEIIIKGGLGLSATIKNTGPTNLTGESCHFLLDGKLIFLGKDKTKMVDIPAGGEVTVKDFVLGFGKTGITVEVAGFQATAEGTVILFFVLGV